MAEDEVFALIGALSAAVWGWGRWSWRLATPICWQPGNARTLLFAVPIVSVMISWYALDAWSASDVRDSPLYMSFYLVLTVGWIGLCANGMKWLGLSARDDVAERRNHAAVLPVAAAILAFTIAFLGANFGDGPGWWVVIFCGGLSTLGLILFWYGVETAYHPMDLITVDRDFTTGLRFSCLILSAGMILGRAAAGDWESVHGTFLDFTQTAWPVLILGAADAFIGKLAGRPQFFNPLRLPLFAILPGCFYLAAAAAYIMSLGAW